MPYSSDLTDEQWELLESVFNAPGKRGREHADDLRSVVDAMGLQVVAYIARCVVPVGTPLSVFGPDEHVEVPNVATRLECADPLEPE
jgi:hypothetical protein